MRVETRVSEGVVGPAKWAAIGALGAAAVFGVAGAVLLRQPKAPTIDARPPAPIQAAGLLQPAAPSREPAPASSTTVVAPDAPTPFTLLGPPAPTGAPTPPLSTPLAPDPKPAPANPATPPTAPPPKPKVDPPPPAPQPKPAPDVKPAAPGKININKATQAELELLPGIGPSLAKRILEYRQQHGPFKRIEDLDNVKGIGPKTLQKLRPLISVE